MIRFFHNQKESVTGIMGLSFCAVLAYLNSALFVVLNGRHLHPTMQIDDWGVIGNSMATVLAWMFFANGKRRSLLQSAAAVILLVLVHYLFISNVWTFLAKRF